MESISTEYITATPYRIIIGYPDSTANPRIVQEMVHLGVTSISFAGSTSIGGLKMLGKGHTGMVVLANTASGQAALKVRRADSPRPDMHREAALLGAANRCGVGPLLMGHTENCILMEYLEGPSVEEWLRTARYGNGTHIKNAIRAILNDCRILDCSGLDHGELANLSKHIIMSRKPTIIDFESASLGRRVSNVASAAQSLYVGRLAKYVNHGFEIPAKQYIIEALRMYKKNPTPGSFERLLHRLNLE